MNLTVAQLAKATELSESTIRVYASKKNLGKKVGNKRVFTQADVQKLLKGSKKSLPKKTPKAPVKKTSKRAIKKGLPKVAKTVVESPTSKEVTPATGKPSVWARIFAKRSK